MLQAVIFDFDGVICDSESVHYQALNNVFNRYGVDVPKAVHWEKYLGLSDKENIEAVNRDYLMGLDDAGVLRLMEEKKREFDRLASQQSLLIEGVEAFVSQLASADVPVAICSGALRSDIDLMLTGSAIKPMFKVIVTAEDVKNGKPNPEGYLLAYQRLSEKLKKPLNCSQCVVFEDSQWGLQAAKAAGMRTVALATTYPKPALAGKADLVVNSYAELNLDILQQLCQTR